MWEEYNLYPKEFPVKGTKVLDDNTLKAIEIDRLEEIVNNTITESGRVIIEKMLRNPYTSSKKIIPKQESLAEIRSNDKLRQGITDFLSEVQKRERQTAGFIRGNFQAYGIIDGRDNVQYGDLRGTRKLLRHIPEWARQIPEPETTYLKALKTDFTNVEKSDAYKFAKGPIFRQLFIKGVRNFKELKPISIPIMFNPTAWKLVYNIPGAMMMGMGVIVTHPMGVYADINHFLNPIRERLYRAPAKSAYRAIGLLDELLAYDTFGKELDHSTLPEVFDNEQHEFFAEQLINSVQSKTIPNYVPNNVNFSNGQRLTFLTGPNSGGKTSLCKAIAHAQVLGQIGCYVPADKAKMSLADKLFYQIGHNDSLGDEEGGFGTQLIQTKKTFFESSPRSLIIIDDLIEGTTFDEKMKLTTQALCGYLHKKPNVIYVTHNHEMAQGIAKQNIGNYIQVEFKGGSPTHRIIPGISTNSHADLVAKRVGFGLDDIREHLISSGYLNKGENMLDIAKYARSGNQIK